MNKIRSRFRIPIARSIDSPFLAELFLVNSIFSIVIIRVFLYLADYPQFGGGVLHIAHILWGGLLMLTSMAILLFLLGRGGIFVASIVGGLGFGVFIDELGKFITTDNDYFFQPTFAIIYLFFIFIFFLFKYIFVKKPLTPEEYLSNASYFLAEIILSKDYDERDEARLKELLEKANADSNLRKEFFALVKHYKTDRKTNSNLYIRIKYYLKEQYTKIVQTQKFSVFLKGFFIVRGVVIIINVSLFIFNANFGNFDRNHDSLGFFELGAIISSFTLNLWVIFGLIKLRSSSIKALKKFRTSTLIAILFYTFFSFYFNQLTAIIGLSIEILILYALELMIATEEQEIPSA